MIYKKYFIAIEIIFLLVLLACAPKEAPGLAKPGQAPVKEGAISRASWEVD